MKHSLKKQQGAETLEFLVVFLMFLMLLMTVFECARGLYVWNSLVEATRRGARMAVICPTFDADSNDIVRRVATFDTVDAGTALGTSPVVKGLTTNAFDIIYYDAAGAEVTDATKIDSIAFISVELNENYQFQFIIPAFNRFVNPPEFRTTLYAESKGVIPYYPGETAPDPLLSCNF